MPLVEAVEARVAAHRSFVCTDEAAALVTTWLGHMRGMPTAADECERGHDGWRGGACGLCSVSAAPGAAGVPSAASGALLGSDMRGARVARRLKGRQTWA